MTVAAEDLSKDCGLTVYADSIWIGGTGIRHDPEAGRPLLSLVSASP